MTANDSDVRDGDTLTGSQVVRVYGENLTAPFVTLTFGGVEYTPLAQGEGYIGFILGDNGTATIKVDGSPIMSFEVEGIVVPENLGRRMTMWMINNDSSATTSPDRYNITTITGNCINYGYKTTAESHFVLRAAFNGEIGEQADYLFSNCEPRSWNQYDNYLATNMVVVDNNLPAYVAYKGFIIAVFNYTTD